jgi:threonine dehydrogenase-like Zn-dependent dehydrogenase
MKTVICEQPGQLALADHAVPTAGPDHVLIRIRGVGICGTDFPIFTGNQPYLSYPVPSAALNAHVVEPGNLPDEFPRLLNPDAGVIKALVTC